jgi:uncharacterized protein YkwD/LysM repeat protein
MRYSLQSMHLAALAACLLLLAAARSQAGSSRGATVLATSRPRPSYSAPTEPAAAQPTPTPAPTRTRVSRSASDDGRGRPPATSDMWDARPPRRLPTPTAPAALLAGSTIHRVEAGDTVYGLAGQHGVSPEVILYANGLDEQSARSLDIGQELIIPFDAKASDEERLVPVPTAVHHVQAGEALILIAQEYGTTVESIVAANDLADAELIRAGQDLIVPLPPPTAAAPTAEPISGTEPLTQTGALAAAPQGAPAEPVSPTVSLTQAVVMTRTDTADVAAEMGATEPISAPEPLAETPAISETVLTEPLTDTVGIGEVLAPEAATDTAPAESGFGADLAMLEAAMLGAINAEREAQGLPAYQVDDTLAAVARAHAQDMVARDYVGHTSPEGERVRDRLSDAGLDLARAGENYYVTTRPADEAVAYTLSWFMGDPPHRRNILHDYYTRIGIGVAYKSPGWYIFVLDFAGD